MGRSRKRQGQQEHRASDKDQPSGVPEAEKSQAEEKAAVKEAKSRKQKPDSRKSSSRRLISRKSDKPAAPQRKVRRLVGFLVLPSVVILLIAAAFLAGNLIRGRQADTVPQTDPDLAQAASPSSITPDTKEYIMDFGGSILKENAVPQIQKLMEQYFLSITDCDMDTFLHLFTSQDTSEEEKYRAIFEKQREYIEGYKNIACYTVKGLNDSSYVVYVSYDMKFVGVDTPGPDLVRVYVVKGDDGQYRIDDEPMTPELEAYLDQVSKNEDVRLLISQVDHQAEEAMSEDEELKKRITYLKNGPPYMQEEKTEQQAEQQSE